MHLKDFQADFFSSMADPQAFRTIFEHLPGIYFFVKDREGRLITASPNILSRLGMQREEEFIGRQDHEVFPPHLAAAYSADDKEVFRTGKPLVDRLEVWFDEHGHLDWCVTTKVPLKGKDGTLIGLMGITRRDFGKSVHQPGGEAMKAVDHLRQNIENPMSMEELSRSMGMSLRTLNRKVNQVFGVSPYELALRVRVQAAAEALLAGSDPISVVAANHGFCDQSTFTQHFRRRMGITPKQFRMRHSTVAA